MFNFKISTRSSKWLHKESLNLFEMFIKDAVFDPFCDPFSFGVAHKYNVKCKRNIYLKYSTRNSVILQSVVGNNQP